MTDPIQLDLDAIEAAARARMGPTNPDRWLDLTDAFLRAATPEAVVALIEIARRGADLVTPGVVTQEQFNQRVGALQDALRARGVIPPRGQPPAESWMPL